MADKLDLSKIYDKIDKLGESVHAIDKKVDRMQVTLDEHDARSAAAMKRSIEAEKKAEEALVPLTYLQRTAAAAKWLSWVGGGLAIIYQLLEWIRG